MATVLVVEDDADLNKTACSYLEMRGFAAIGAANAPQAYDVLGATVSLESSPGVGSTFTVRLPSH